MAMAAATGASEILWVGPGRFWVIERDDRGVTDADPLGLMAISTKRVYEISLIPATNVKDISVAGVLDLPAGTNPVSKTLVFDLQSSLAAAGEPIAEKYEGITFGPQLSDGNYMLLIGSDNDMSMTRDATSTVLLDVWVNEAEQQVRYTPFDDPSHSYASLDLTTGDLGPMPSGYSMLPSHLVAVVPEPSAMLTGAVLAAHLLRRRKDRRS